MVSETPARRERRPVRILDAPCGDFTWMPGCLERIRAALGVRLHYTGADIVPELVAQLNAGRGHMLVDGTRASVGEGIRAEWIVLDQSDTAAMLNLKKTAMAYDIIISKHMFIHLQSEARRANRTARSVRHSAVYRPVVTPLGGPAPWQVILQIVDNWNALGAQYLVTDDYAAQGPSGCRGGNWNWIDTNHPFPYHEPNLREPPFALKDPVCSQPDAAFCESSMLRCDSNINIFEFPLLHERADFARAVALMRPNGTTYQHLPTIEQRRHNGDLRGRTFLFCHNLTSTPDAANYTTPRGQRMLRNYHPNWAKLYPSLRA